MRLMAPTVWTARRKLMGNLIPALFWLPPALAGVWLILRADQHLGLGLALLGLATVAGWVAMSWFGYFENAKMRRQLERILSADGTPLPDGRIFVGFATPAYSSVLDAHEDVGFLLFDGDAIQFVSETRSVEVYRGQVQRVRYRLNPHSFVFLGRWISVEGSAGDRPIRMMLEPRERRTMWANRRFGRELRQRLDEWAKE
jgi:hypothetical protein